MPREHRIRYKPETKTEERAECHDCGLPHYVSPECFAREHVGQDDGSEESGPLRGRCRHKIQAVGPALDQHTVEGSPQRRADSRTQPFISM